MSSARAYTKIIRAIFLIALITFEHQLLAQQPSGCFTPTVGNTYSVTGSPIDLVSTDLNNDGKKDIVTGNFNNTNQLSVLLGTGTGSFLPALSYTTFPNTYNLCTGDFNLDGNADIAASYWLTSQVAVLFGDGLGGFSSVTSYSVIWPRELIATDLDSDGNLDLLVANSNSASITQLKGSAAGTFVAVNIYTLGSNPIFIAKGNFNSDSYIDVAVATITDQLKIFLGTASGTLSMAASYTLGNGIWEIAPADYNNDTKTDLAINLGTPQSLLLLTGNGDGTFSTSASFPGLASNTRGICTADFNVDGKPDVSSGSSVSGQVSVLFGTGTGSFSPIMNLTSGGISPNNVISDDFNNDGRPDIAAANYLSGSVTIFLSAVGPTVSATAQGNNLCAGVGVTLTASGVNTYTWSNAMNSPSIVVTPSITSNYTVVGSSSNACTNSVVITASVIPLPVVSVNSGSICGGNSFTLIPTGASTYTFLNSSSIVTPSVTSTYSIIGTSTSGCTSQGPALSTVIVHSNPTISVNSGSICTSQVFTIVPFGASTYSITGGSNTVSPSSTTGYTVVGYSGFGCVSINTVVSNVTVSLSPTISANSGTVCNGQSFTITPTGAATYTITGGNPIVSPTVNTNYTITGSSTQGCISNAIVSSVIVNMYPNITVGSGSICSGQSFTMFPVGAITYTFSSVIPVVSPTVNTTYSITGTGVNGCVTPTYAICYVSVQPLPTITVNSGAVCLGNSFTFNPTGANSYTYLNSLPVITPTASSSYSILGSSFGCMSSSPAVSTVIVLSLPNISATSSSPTLCAGSSATLTGNGAITYSWNTISSMNPIVVTPTATTTYTLKGTGGNGCIKIITLTQVVTVCTEVPDLKSINGIFSIYPNPNNGEFNISAIERMEIYVYNMLFQLIIHQEIREGSNIINISDKPNGIYYIRTQKGKYRHIEKVIKN